MDPFVSQLSAIPLLFFRNTFFLFLSAHPWFFLLGFLHCASNNIMNPSNELMLKFISNIIFLRTYNNHDGGGGIPNYQVWDDHRQATFFNFNYCITMASILSLSLSLLYLLHLYTTRSTIISVMLFHTVHSFDNIMKPHVRFFFSPLPYITSRSSLDILGNLVLN